MSNNLKIGHMYKANTAEDLFVTPIYILSDTRAVFTTSNFEFTPFVIWTYKVTDDEHKRIDLASGEYYRTLLDALESELIVPIPEDPKPRLHMDIDIFCSDCGQLKTIGVNLEDSVQTFTEQISDELICNDCGTVGGVSNLTFVDDTVIYEVPIYR